MDRVAEPALAYDPIMRAVHWVTLALITAAYCLIWLAHSGAAGANSKAVLQLHRSVGLTIAALTLLRLAWRWRARVPALPADLLSVQKMAARLMEGLIYVLLLAHPLLGLLQTNARGQLVDLYLLGALSPIVSPDKAFAHLTHELHELGGNVLLALIGVHAAAALFHHFIRRDAVLLTMLPARLHGVSEHLRSRTRRGKLPTS